MLKGESRDGFYISSMMKRVWAVQMKILTVIDEICKRHNLTWFADWGTLLGAVRNQGYIPWDDDLDISMRRVDFEIFKKKAQVELPAGYICINDRNTGMNDCVYCIRNTENICVESDFLRDNFNCPYAVGVDIFVYDNVPDDFDEQELYLSMFSYAFSSGKRIDNNANYYQSTDEVKQMIDHTEELTGIHFDKEKAIKNDLLKLADQIAAMYYDCDTKRVSITPYAVLDEKHIFNKEWFADRVFVPFEDMQIPIPSGYHEILKQWYGEDYMIPKRIYTDHEYPYYKKQEKALLDACRKNDIDSSIFFEEK